MPPCWCLDSHGASMVLSRCLQGASMDCHGASMVLPWTSMMFSWMVLSWCVHGAPIILSWGLHHASMVLSWTPMVFSSWCCRDLSWTSMVIQWCFHSGFMEFHGSFILLPWRFHEPPWCFHDAFKVLSWMSTVLPWCFHVFPWCSMVLSWRCILFHGAFVDFHCVPMIHAGVCALMVLSCFFHDTLLLSSLTLTVLS